MPFVYPAAVGLMFLWTTLLPYGFAYAVWTGISTLCLVVSVRLWQRELRLDYLDDWPLLAATVFAPVAACLLYGQLSLLLLFLYSLAFAQYRKGNQFLAGFLVGLGTVKYQLILGFVLVMLLRRAWKSCAGAAISGGLVVAASAAVIGWRQLLDYPAFVVRVAAYYPVLRVPSKMINLRGLLDLILGHEPAVWFVGILSLALLASAAYSWGEQNHNLGFAVAMALSMVTSYHAFPQEGCLLIPLLMLALRDLPEGKAIPLMFGVAILSASAGLDYEYPVRLFNLYPACALLLVAFFWHRTMRLQTAKSVLARREFRPVSTGAESLH